MPNAQPEMPAVLVEGNAESRANLVKVIGEMLGTSVSLADDALTASDTLLIERKRLRDASGRQMIGRDVGYPDVFKLVKSGDQCILIHESSKKRSVLESSRCQAKSINNK